MRCHAVSEDAGVAVSVDNGLMTMRGKWWLGGVAGGVVSAGVGTLFLRAGLEDADRWASVFGVFLNLAGLAAAVYSAVWTRRAAAVPPPPTAGGYVDNTIRGGRFAGPVVQARDLEQVSADSAASPGTAPSPAAGDVGPGAVSNLIEDGQFDGPVIQGRDLRGVSLPAPGTRPRQERQTS